ncbi:MAG: hypothetical protein JW719_09340 [Pirellulales bacterium]|nr:hypothetical protein [Pirellulales bacterium]
MSDSLFLCARPSFVEGASRLLDFGGTLNEYNKSLTAAQADYLAIYSDWRMIGLDFAQILDAQTLDEEQRIL